MVFREFYCYVDTDYVMAYRESDLCGMYIDRLKSDDDDFRELYPTFPIWLNEVLRNGDIKKVFIGDCMVW